MTAKRFTRKKRISKYGHGTWWEYYYEGQEINTDELILFGNNILDENERLKSELLDIEEDRDYYKSKASNLEEGYIQLQDREIRLKKENEQLKQKNTMLNKDLKYITNRKNHLESEWDKFYELVDKKIKKLEDKYEFGRTKYDACPMHNIRFGINVLKELLRELEE